MHGHRDVQNGPLLRLAQSRTLARETRSPQNERMRGHCSSSSTSANCSAICVAARAARRGRGGQEIMGTSITCSGTEMSKCLTASTSWSPDCGTGASRICTIGAKRTKSTICSTVCRWTRSCGPGGSARLAGRLPPGSSSNKLKSTGWGGGGFCRRGASFLSSCLLPGPRRLLALCAVVRKHGPGLGDRLLLMPPSSTQSSPSPTLGSSCHGLPAEVHRER